MKDIDIWRTAGTLIVQHGADAPIIAAQRFDGLATDDLDGRIIWYTVNFAIQALLAKEKPLSATGH